MSKLYDTNTMRLAELKYYSKEDNGVEVSSPLSLGVFMLLGGQWFNVFDVSDDSIIFERLKYYGNVTSDGLEYGSKLKVVSDEEKDVSGPCWILDDEPFSKTIGKDIVTVKEIEDYLLDSKEYFKDRNDIAHQRLLSWSEPARMVSIIKKDNKSKMKMDEFFAERGHVIQKVKKG